MPAFPSLLDLPVNPADLAVVVRAMPGLSLVLLKLLFQLWALI